MAEVSVEQQVNEEGGGNKPDSDLLIIHPEMLSLLSLAARRDSGKSSTEAGQEQKQLSNTKSNYKKLDVFLRYMEICPMPSGKKASKTT